MTSLTIIGTIAATGTTAAFVPQVIYTVRTKDTHGISLYMYVFFIIGLFMWLIYGLMLLSYPIIIANGITILLAGIVLFYKIKHG